MRGELYIPACCSLACFVGFALLELESTKPKAGMYKFISGPPPVATEFLTVSTIDAETIDADTIDVDTIIVEPGTASAPSISFKNDSNTGIYSEADDTVNITANGLKQVTVSPTAFRIEGPFNIKAQGGNAMLNFLRASDEAVSTTFRVRDTLNDPFFNGLSQRGITDFEQALFSGGSNYVNRSNGKALFLHTSKGATDSGANNSIEVYTTDAGTFRRDVEIVAQINRGGRVLCRGQPGIVDTTFPNYSFENDSNTGLLWELADEFSLVTNATRRMTVNNTRTAVLNTLRYTGSTPTAGYVLQTDSNGDAIWADIETIGNLATVTGNYTGASTIAHETLRYSKSNGICHIEYDEEKKVETSASGSLNLTALPAGYRPARAQTTTYLYNTTIPSGNDTVGRVEISTAGVVSFKADLAGGDFTSGGSFLIRRWSFSYLTV